MPADARTLAWDNPMCKEGAVAVTDYDLARQRACPAQSKDQVEGNTEQSVLSMEFEVNQGKPCFDSEETAKPVPCINTNKRCITSVCRANRDAFNRVTFAALQNIIAAAGSVCDPRTRYAAGNSKAQGQEGWVECTNYQVGALSNLQMSDIQWGWKTMDNNGFSGEAQLDINFIAKVSAPSTADSATLRTIISATDMDFPGVLTAAFRATVSAGLNATIADAFATVNNWLGTAGNSFDFDTEQIRFGEFSDTTYTTPPSDDTDVVYNLGDDDALVTPTAAPSSQITLDQVPSLSLEDGGIAYYDSATKTFMWSDTAASTMKLKTLFMKGDEIEESYYLYTELKEELEDLEKTISDKLDENRDLLANSAGQGAGREAVEANQVALTNFKIEIGQEIRNAGTQLSNVETKKGFSGTDDPNANKSSSDTVVYIIIGVVLVLCIVGAMLIIRSRKNGPGRLVNRPTTHQNPAYEQPKGGAGAPPANAPQGQRPGGARPAGAKKPAGAQKPNVQHDGQRKVLVLDPYGNDA